MQMPFFFHTLTTIDLRIQKKKRPNFFPHFFGNANINGTDLAGANRWSGGNLGYSWVDLQGWMVEGGWTGGRLGKFHQGRWRRVLPKIGVSPKWMVYNGKPY